MITSWMSRRRDSGGLDGGLGRGGTELRGGHGCEHALEGADRGALGGDDDDVVARHGDSSMLRFARLVCSASVRGAVARGSSPFSKIVTKHRRSGALVID